jgi:hypothetical protein
MTVIAAEPSYDVGALWRSVRYPAILIAVLLGLVAVVAAIGVTPNSEALDPRNPAPNGARALSVLLAERGAAVGVATTVSDLQPTAGTTVLLTDPDAVSSRALHTIAASSAVVVIVEPSRSALAILGVAARFDADTGAETIGPQCGLGAAETAGTVRVAGSLYTVRPGASGCYLIGGDAALVTSTRSNGARTIVLGSASTLTNAELAKSGNAALALGLLDSPVVRWVPGGLHSGAVAKSQQGLFNLLPPRLIAAVVQLFVALIVLALWRARRLGRPVAEPLPVVVRAAETVEGRARLMRAARARDTAARALRTASVRRLGSVLRLGADEDPAAVIALVAERTGTPTEQIRGVLYGGEPSDDESLVRLAQELPRLEAAIRHDDPPTGGQP